MQFESPYYIVLLLFALLLVVRLFYVYNWKLKAQNAFADPQLAQQIFRFSNLKKFIQNNFLIILSVFFIVLALMDLISPGDEQDVEIQGADVVYCLDLSNSMDAEDIAPSRLQKAKLLIQSTLEKTSSDRVGLVVFAYNGYAILPLTQDYEALSSYLDVATTKSITSQGTRFEEAIKAASELFNREDLTIKNLVILSDGEDQSDDIRAAIDVAEENDLRIISVGIGTSKGSVIPESKRYQSTGLLLDENNNPVISKLDESSLKKLSSKTQGTYIYAHTIEDTSMKIVSAIKAGNSDSSTLSKAYVSDHHFQLFIGLALLLIIIVSLTNIRTEFNI